jgi:hypothetical protein
MQFGQKRLARPAPLNDLFKLIAHCFRLIVIRHDAAQSPDCAFYLLVSHCAASRTICHNGEA